MSSSASKAKLPRWIDYQPISDVKGAERNPKQHSPELGSAIDRFGFADGVILDERTGRLVAGHGRLERLKLMQEEGQDAPDGIRVLKGKWLLPVQRGWSSRSDKEAEAFLVAHNRLTEAGGWDDRALFELLEQFEGDDLAGLGVDETYLGELQERVDELNEDDLPEGEDPGGGEPPADPVSERGEVYALGPHRLMCGDSTSAEDVTALLGGEVPTVVSDPPYGLGFGYDQHDDSDNDANLELVRSAFGDRPRVWTPGLRNIGRDLSWNPGAKVLSWWKKFAASGSGLGGASTWEPILVVGIKGGTLPNDHLEFMTDRDPIAKDHPCPKPVALYSHLIDHLTSAGAVVYDPFLGSGTTLIAAARTGRKCYGMEISPAYCDVIRKRWGDWARSADVDPGPDAL